ncbi:class I SAM-dependent methyltransferase [Pontibacter populi]|uniref:Class I SAM-dependent methyltransferase n=1 Tax=Pontibacter populi TaxID=890055 RepID=A0ABV1RYB1_9BACT
MMQEFWNERYKQPEMAYGKEPNAFFREQLDKLQPGKLLLPAEGEGRNAVYAATIGWQVQAFDYSEAGRTKALQLADALGVTIDYTLSEAENYTSGPESYDAVALIYAHFPPAIRHKLHQQVKGWLKPGGTVMLEAFHPKQMDGYTSGGPQNHAMLYTADMLRSDFTGLKIKVLQEYEITLHEGIYHNGAGYVTRLVATKPTADQI